jgi:hypothetical protein
MKSFARWHFIPSLLRGCGLFWLSLARRKIWRNFSAPIRFLVRLVEFLMAVAQKIYFRKSHVAKHHVARLKHNDPVAFGVGRL